MPPIGRLQPGTHREEDSGKCPKGNRQFSLVASDILWAKIHSIPWLPSPLLAHYTLYLVPLSSSNLLTSFLLWDVCTCCPICMECPFFPLPESSSCYLLDLRVKGTFSETPSPTPLFKVPSPFVRICLFKAIGLFCSLSRLQDLELCLSHKDAQIPTKWV